MYSIIALFIFFRILYLFLIYIILIANLYTHTFICFFSTRTDYLFCFLYGWMLSNCHFECFYNTFHKILPSSHLISFYSLYFLLLFSCLQLYSCNFIFLSLTLSFSGLHINYLWVLVHLLTTILISLESTIFIWTLHLLLKAHRCTLYEENMETEVAFFFSLSTDFCRLSQYLCLVLEATHSVLYAKSKQ